VLDIEGLTLFEIFEEAVERWPDNDFLVVPAAAGRAYYPDGWIATYREMARLVDRAAGSLAAAGYGVGHRVAVDLENRPEHVVLKFAFAKLGISMVPINPDLRPAEAGYLLSDSASILAIAAENRVEALSSAIAESGLDIALVEMAGESLSLPAARSERLEVNVSTTTESSVLYTSGTTGRPKGCLLSQGYEAEVGHWYARLRGRISYTVGAERLFNPLPLFHINSGVCSLLAMLVTGNCQIQPERFSGRTWWRDIALTEATAIHYLGVVVPALLDLPSEAAETEHQVRVGVGAGVEPSLHDDFEQRFGFPLVEVWGMTEICRLLADNHEPRSTTTRAIGRPARGLEVRVVDENDTDVPADTSGELLIRHSAGQPRRGFFSGYLNQPEATEQAWRGGWFHTGDTVTLDDSQLVTFVDRSKNIIRRSGENISAAEVEACLHAHERVTQVAVLAVSDDVRDEEVYACVVARAGVALTDELANELFDHCYEQMAYYKAPGWLLFVDELPVTGTQKIMKHQLFDEAVDPCSVDDVFDLRSRKKRDR